MPALARTSAATRAKLGEPKRVSYPKITPRDASSWFKTYEAIAPATRRTLAKVKSSAMIARQPSVPNLIAAVGCWLLALGSDGEIEPRSSIFGGCVDS